MVGRPTVIALGGNAISPADGAGTAAEQTANITRTMRQVAVFVATVGDPVVLTHGNGPQVGNILIKNERARDVVPPVPLDWCVAQTQATIGFTIACALEHALTSRGMHLPVVPVVSRVRVDADDPAWQHPSKPIGPWLGEIPPAELERRMSEGQVFVSDAKRGHRRLVPSPEPRECLDLAAIRLLLGHDAIVVANGGGGIPVVAGDDGQLHGVEGVIDKDLAAALLAAELDASFLAILTDVPGVAVGFGTPTERWLGQVTVAELRELADDGVFGTGSMAPKVDAACRFVEHTGARAVIARLDDLTAALAGQAGTVVAA